MSKPIHKIKNIVTGETLCGLKNKAGKFLIAIEADTEVSCKKCKKKEAKDE